jgi:serine/threonine protein kinase
VADDSAVSSLDYVGKYRLIELVGSGAMGVVYRARDEVLLRDVAIKLLAGTCVEATAERFLVEARAAARLNHPNIVTVFDFGDHPRGLYIVMEFVQGRGLDELVRDGIPGPVIDKAKAVRDVAGALAAAHEQGVVHRDIKPGNIRITREGVPKLLDFGIARFRESSLTVPNHVIGTPCYMAPEVLRGEPADEQSDVFGFGATAYEWLTGVRAFRGDSADVVMWHVFNEEPIDPCIVNREIHRKVADVVQRALQKDPARRFASMAEMCNALDAAIEEAERTHAIDAALLWRKQPAVQPPTSTDETVAVARSGTRRSVQWIALVCGLCAVLAIASPTRQSDRPLELPSRATIEGASSGFPNQPLRTLRPRAVREPKADAHAPHMSDELNIVTLVPPNATDVPAQDDQPLIPIARAGSELFVQLLADLDSDRARAGDEFRATLSEPWVDGDHAVASPGAPVTGQINEVGRSSDGRPYLDLILTSATIGSDQLSLRTGVYRIVAPAHSRGARSLIIAAGAGAIAGGLIGGKIGIPIGAATGAGVALVASASRRVAVVPGHRLPFRLAEPLILRR